MARIRGIYRITNTTNGHTYIGRSLNVWKRLADHLCRLNRGNHHSRYLQHAFNHYGRDVFEFGLIAELENYEADSVDAEQFWMDHLKPEYNVSPSANGPLGIKHTEEYREACRQRMLGCTPWNKGLRGVQPSTRKGIKTGKTTSQKHKDATSKRFKGVPLSDEHKAKISRAHIGKKLSPEAIAKRTATRRANGSY